MSKTERNIHIFDFCKPYIIYHSQISYMQLKEKLK